MIALCIIGPDVDEDESFTSEYNLELVEAMRQTMVAEGGLPDLAQQDLSVTQLIQIDMRITMEREAVQYGGVEEMLKCFESEFENAKVFSSLAEFMLMLTGKEPDG